MLETGLGICILAIALSGVPAFLPLAGVRRRVFAGAVVHIVSSLVGIALVLSAFFHSWEPAALQRYLRVDLLAGVFLIPVFFVSASGVLYGSQYILHHSYHHKHKMIQLCFGLLSAALLLVVSARNIYLFLSAFELMALSAFFLVATDQEKAEVRAASWLYLAAAHASILALIAFFCVLQSISGNDFFDVIQPGAVSASGAALLFGLALFGFGMKAGVYPLHFWLPPAHAAAPSHVSAVMSGVLIKIGIYGMLRTVWILPPLPASWGFFVMALGAVSAVMGVVHALCQHDLKRLLAYHSVENIGIIVLAVGLALVGRAYGRPALVVAGFAAGLLHVWNHSLFKGLLFLSAGAAVHAAKTRVIDCLGGLGKKMPYTSCFFLIGAAAIVGLPPLNGFVSELILYIGLGYGVLASEPFLFVACGVAFACLALAGALALACFAKVFGVAFLGEARSPQAAHAREAGRTMRAGMLPLALACVGIGALPTLVLPLFYKAIGASFGRSAAAEFSDGIASVFYAVQGVSIVLLVFVLLLMMMIRKAVRRAPETVTWDCGFIAPTPRLQYSASSFAELLITIFSSLLAPSLTLRRLKEFFPKEFSFHSSTKDLVFDLLITPGCRLVERIAMSLRPLQRGMVQAYLFYVFVTLLLLLVLNAAL